MGFPILPSSSPGSRADSPVLAIPGTPWLTAACSHPGDLLGRSVSLQASSSPSSRLFRASHPLPRLSICSST